MINDRVVAQGSAKHAELFLARISELFERLPMLCGFHVTAGLEVVEVSVHTWPGWVPASELSDEIRAALEDLVSDGNEQTAGLLRGRTFARVFH
jgi:hypothetical protein